MPPQTDELAPYDVSDLAPYEVGRNKGAGVDYDALASQYGGRPDYDALAAKHGGTKAAPDEVLYDPNAGDVFDQAAKGDVFDQISPNTDLKTGRGMIERSQAQARQQLQRPLDNAVAPGQRAIGERPTLASRAAEVTLGDPHPLRRFMQSDLPAFIASPGDYAKKLGRAEIEAPARLAYSATHHPIDTAVDVTGGGQFARDLADKNYQGMAGDILGGAANVYGMKELGESASPLAESAGRAMNSVGIPSELPDVLPGKNAVAHSFRTSAGDLRPGARIAAKVAGTAAGGLAGRALGPYGGYLGAGLGAQYGPKILDAIIPDLPRRIVPEAPTAGRLPAQISAAGESAMPDVITVPEPREPNALEKPGSMYSVERSKVLDAARRGKPGAMEVLRDLGNPMIIVPRGTGYPGPRVASPE